MERHGVKQVDNKINNLDENGDFIFRFRIETEEIDTLQGKPFEELFKNTIHEMLKYIVFFKDNEKVEITGFAFCNNPEVIYSIYDDE
ncbi:hypothetical protein BBF96_08090 [Anoxybacter fermentans]|uniref:Uncharacterized protein n=1 Tax=Anoxybacter fermentans TaxID=1323375 RepID=A0A3Q9HQF4_9FIRM|nr:hypothetical protein [Anoxybacter fermentans]AZR73344.1 hypothetical protein BBF96_08090 [Anoxybacter fermentans]